MINIIFIAIILIGIVYSFFSGNIDEVINVLLSTPRDAFFIFVDIYALLIFWGGILEICKQSGLLKIITMYISKIIHPLFNNLDPDGEALQYISMNFVANMFSMGSAATPFGLKAMEELDKINGRSKVASDEMITFLLINTSGLCLIPTTLISLRNQADSANPVMIIPYIAVVSCIVTFFAIVLDIGVRKHGKH